MAAVADAAAGGRTKADLLEGCATRGIPVISALGAGSKADPTRIIIGDLMDTVNDPLALKLRWELRTRWEKQRTADGGKSEWGKKKKIEPEGFDVRVVSSYEKVGPNAPPPRPHAIMRPYHRVSRQFARPSLAFIPA